jgi:ribosomal protein S5
VLQPVVTVATLHSVTAKVLSVTTINYVDALVQNIRESQKEREEEEEEEEEEITLC